MNICAPQQWYYSNEQKPLQTDLPGQSASEEGLRDDCSSAESVVVESGQETSDLTLETYCCSRPPQTYCQSVYSGQET